MISDYFPSKRGSTNGQTMVNTSMVVSFFQREDLLGMSEFKNEQFQKILKILKQPYAEEKKLVAIESDVLKSGLSALRDDFPNFKEVIDFIEGELAIYGRGVHKNLVKFSPILLGGTPGIGKTEFSRRISSLLGVPMNFTDMSGTSSSRVLGGSDSTWKDSKPGVVFNQLLDGDVANPIFFLDEIDKVPQRAGEGYALTALYALLEKSSNTSFKDEFFPLPINTKYVNFIAAGNNISLIPEPIKDRFNYFDVPKPTGIQLRNIAKSVMRSLLNKDFPEGHGLSEELSEDVLHYIEQSDLTPRTMNKLFKESFKKALKDGRVMINLSDVNPNISSNTMSLGL